MTKKEIESAKAQRVRKANSLIQQSRYSLSIQQQKILLFLISQIQPEDDDFKTYDFSIRDFCQICGIDCNQGNNYKELKDNILDIMKHPVGWVELEEGKETVLLWIEKPIISRNDGIVQLKLDKDMKPYLLNLKANFTSYEVGFTLKFRSKYAIRLYELAKSYQYHDDTPFTRVYPIDELREILDAETYPQYKNFKQRVLTPAIREINEYSDKTIELLEHKTGRAGKVQNVELTISAKQGEALNAVRALIGARPRRQPATPVDATAPGKRSAAPRQKKPTKENVDSGSASGSGLLDIQRMQSRLGAGTEMI